MALDDIAAQPKLPTAPDGADETSERAARQIDQAKTLLQQQRFTEALQRLERALRYSPQSWDAHILSATVAMQAGNDALALEHTRRAEALRPRASEVHYLKGRVHLALGDNAKTIESFRVQRICPDHDDATALARLGHYYLGIALEQSRHLLAAADEFSRFAETTSAPDDPRHAEAEELELSARIKVAEAFDKLGQVADAARWLDEAAALDPRNADLPERIARLFQRAGRHEDAAKAARRCYELGGDGLELLVHIRQSANQQTELSQDLAELATQFPDRDAIIHQFTGHHTRFTPAAGIEFLKHHLAAHPEAVRAWVAQAELLAVAHRWEDSLDAIAQAIAVSSDPEESTRLWVDRIVALDTLSSTAQEITESMTLGTHPGRDYAIAILASRAGLEDAALAACSSATAADPQFVAAHIACGEAYLAQFDWKAARRSAALIVDQAPTDYRGYRLLGLAHLGMDRYNKATEVLILANHHNHRDVATLEALVETYQRSGQPLKARQQYQFILEVDPGHARAHEELLLLAMGQRDQDRVEAHLAALSELPDRRPYERMHAFVTARIADNWDAYLDKMQTLLEADPADMESRLHLVQVLLSLDRGDTAREELVKALEAQPDHLDALGLLARMDAGVMRYADASTTYERLIAIHPNRVTWQEGLVAVLLDDMQFGTAAQRLQSMLDTLHLDDSTRRSLEYDLLMCQILTDRVDDAAALTQAWFEKTEATSEQLHYLRLQAHALRRNGTQAAVIPSIEALYEQSSRNDRRDVLEIMVDVYLLDERGEDAAALLLDWLEIDPEDAVLTDRLVRTFSQMQANSSAIELAQVAVARPQDYRTANHFNDTLVRLFQDAGRYDDAQKQIRKQFDALDGAQFMGDLGRGRVHDLHAQLAQTLLMAHRIEEALMELDAWERELTRETIGGSGNPAIRPHLEILHSLRSLGYSLNDQPSLALQEQERRWQTNPVDAGAANDLGYQWAAAGVRLDEAETLVRGAVARNPRLAAYLDSLGWVLYKQGAYEEAHRWLLRAARAPTLPWTTWLVASPATLGASDPVISDHLGDAAWRIGQPGEARARWEQALQLAAAQDPDATLSTEINVLLKHLPEKLAALAEGRTPSVADGPTPAEP
jgi:tetratricopeptide (TPR) repeat protein